MNQNLIYLEEMIQRNSFILYLYIIRFPTNLQEQQQLIQIIKNQNIQIIYYFGTQSFIFENLHVPNISLEKEEQREQVIQKMKTELTKQNNNIGLMCTKTCEKSLQIYFHYMVQIEQRKFEDFNFKLFEQIWTQEQLKLMYEQINNNKKITIFDYNLLLTNSNIGSQISREQIQSQVVSSEQPQKELISQSLNDDNLMQKGSQQQSSIQQKSNILGLDDQVISEILPVSHFFQNSQLSEITNSENNIRSTQHSLRFESKYQLPQSITFVNFIPKNGFRCLE
ncbi:unnamed protein product [Paramecium pentaurelia]|uniref:Uncharacterized protein n=1 Tax=Paramecium pentaurelia TaxID=43138 RepID=A0A8S1Y2P3_9CILI|nr:unnamed protein product [Paramecium pentaurelia]